MYEDQGMDFNYDQPQPYNDADSGPEIDDNSDDGDEFSTLFKDISGWYVCFIFSLSFFNNDLQVFDRHS
jgi:hypothetical protein